MLDALPNELFVSICCFVQVDAFVRLRRTCTTLRAASTNVSWHQVLFEPKGAWHQLKDVNLAAKYMNWSNRVPSAVPSSLQTMDTIAFWGTVVDTNGDILESFHPQVAKFDVYSMWVYPPSISYISDEYTWNLKGCKLSLIHI